MIGIYAPYDLSDTTTMAIGLAALASSLGHSVSYYCAGDKQSNVHDLWDHKVKSEKLRVFSDWAERCDHIVWFNTRHDHVAIAKKKKCINTLVVLHDWVSDGYNTCYVDFEYIMVPSPSVHKYLASIWSPSIKLNTLPWDTCTPIVNKNGLNDSNKIWVYMPLQNTAGQMFGAKLFYALSVVLDKAPKLNLTIAKSKRLTTDAYNALADLQSNFSKRVRVIKTPKQDLRNLTYQQHDWTFYPASCDDVHLPAIQSLYSGTPVVSLAVSNANECVVNGMTGQLIPCKTYTDKRWELLLHSDPSVKDLIEGLDTSIANANAFNQLIGRPWPFLETRRRNFTDVWKAVWSETRAS